MCRAFLLSISLFLTACSSYPLGDAVSYGDLEEVRSTLEAGADPNGPTRSGRSVLFNAVLVGKPEPVIRTLLEYGADPNGGDVTDPQPFHGGPLHVAESAKTVNTLLEFGADPSLRRKDGSTPLHSASTGDIARALIVNGADVDARNNHGSTPLHDAGRPDVVTALLDNGADPLATDAAGRTAAQLMRSRIETHRSWLSRHPNHPVVQQLHREPLAQQQQALSTLYDAIEGADTDAGDAGDQSDLASRVIENSSGRYLSPYTSDGVVAEWVNKSTNNQMGSATGSAVGGAVGAAVANEALDNVPGGAIIGGFFGSKAGKAVGNKMADNVSGGDAYRRQTSDLSFHSFNDMATWLVEEHGDKANFSEVVNATESIYPGLRDAITAVR